MAKWSILSTTKQDNVGDLKCDICEELVKLLDGVITKNSSEQEINETLHRLCEGLPAGAFQDIVSVNSESAVVQQNFNQSSTIFY